MAELSDEGRRILRHVMETADMLKQIGVTDHRQVESRPGPEGFFTRLAALFAEGDQCPCGGEHIPSDHDA